MDQTKLLVGVSASITESAIQHYLPDLPDGWDGIVSYVEGNASLRKVMQEYWPDATAIAAKSPVSARKAIQGITHLVLLWDGEDLLNLLFEARLSRIKTKLIPVQVTRVVNKNKTDEFDVYIGRGSPWGNPFAIGHGEGPNRAEVIEKYREYFNEKIAKDESFRKGVLGMKGLRLACFCKPEACHGDVIAEYLDGFPGSED
jgi:Domain of unknown function (DUF4326)